MSFSRLNKMKSCEWVQNRPFVLETVAPAIQSSRHRGTAGPHIAHSGGVTDSLSHPGCSYKHKHHQGGKQLQPQPQLQTNFWLHHNETRGSISEEWSVNREAAVWTYPSAVQCCDLLCCRQSAQSKLHLTGTLSAAGEDDMSSDSIVSASPHYTFCAAAKEKRLNFAAALGHLCIWWSSLPW